jgi:hypothetical protein
MVETSNACSRPNENLSACDFFLVLGVERMWGTGCRLEALKTVGRRLAGIGTGSNRKAVAQKFFLNILRGARSSPANARATA